MQGKVRLRADLYSIPRQHCSEWHWLDLLKDHRSAGSTDGPNFRWLVLGFSDFNVSKLGFPFSRIYTHKSGLFLS